MQRLTQERGAVSVVVALLMVPLLGFAALSIDIAGMWSEQQQLQSGADAGALAVAQDCARNNCQTPSQTVQTMATANVNDGLATATVTPGVTPTSGQVTVSNAGVRHYLFAEVLGHSQATITTTATAGWGSPTGGTAALPLTFSICEFNAQTGGGLPSGTTTRVIYFTKSSGTNCTGPSHNAVPGGFGWVTPDSGTCSATSSTSSMLSSSTGSSVPGGCTAANIAAQQGQVVLLPIFDQASGNGANASYHVYGYAAFRLVGYNFKSKYTFNASECLKPNVDCIKGYFLQFVDMNSAFHYGSGAPNLGASVVTLTK
ncbi:pilus assembly protein TadG-related protein [Allobranchiibius huperziae]|uniref:Flp pilus assembly protein TadG n=1 Tax=Allobranchiibius huperziae TaxID=1874116 RepID=A0A853DGX7_9MICO|nr:Tad domain-containing protein [Allobranchiibius huperziae]NYJ74294.1 Flp pilus assembly protein TadG [Allobranchiibius huperziae]